jgi:hypothetical protein
VLNDQYYVVRESRAGRINLVRGPISAQLVPRSLHPEHAKNLLKDNKLPVVSARSQLVGIGFQDPVVSTNI